VRFQLAFGRTDNAPRSLVPVRESFAARRERARIVLERLGEVYPTAACALIYRNPFQLLIATVLSAQTTDERVNSVTPELFARYPTAQALAGAPLEDLERILHPLGFFRSKAKSVKGIGIALTERYDGAAPADLDELVTLPGVGRKTANVVLGNAFGIPGITVDTHVGRLTRRLGWTKQTDPVKAERDLMKLWDPSIWTIACHRLIFHGRQVCTARNPKCEICPIADLCPRIGVGTGSARRAASSPARGRKPGSQP